jgi:putative transposase
MRKRRKTMSDKSKAEQFGEVDFNQLDHFLSQQVKKMKGAIALGGPDFVKELTRRTYQALLDAEMEEHLGYSRHEENPNASEGNYRNGRGKKVIKGDFGELEINPPRDRKGTFEPTIIKKRESTVGNFTDKIISLYARGMTTRDISEHLYEIYQIEASESLISRAVSHIQEDVVEWQNRPLDPFYTILYIDGVRFSVRGENGKVTKKCFYTVLGVPLSGKQEVLGLWIADTEGASFWLSVLTEIKKRGVKDVLIACVDGLCGMTEAIQTVFPDTDVQLCIVHHIRNCTKFVPYKDRKAICADMKHIYEAPNEQAAKAALDQLNKKWGHKYPAVILKWEEKWDLLTQFLHYPIEIRKITYTTNAVEALHALLRKNTSNRKVFPDDSALFRLLYLNIINLSNKWTKRQNWNTIIGQLVILFPERVNKFLTQNLD